MFALCSSDSIGRRFSHTTYEETYITCIKTYKIFINTCRHEDNIGLHYSQKTYITRLNAPKTLLNYKSYKSNIVFEPCRNVSLYHPLSVVSPLHHFLAHRDRTRFFSTILKHVIDSTEMYYIFYLFSDLYYYITKN
jgi:hypothetical protein